MFCGCRSIIKAACKYRHYYEKIKLLSLVKLLKHPSSLCWLLKNMWTFIFIFINTKIMKRNEIKCSINFWIHIYKTENIFVITAGEKGVSGDAAVKFVKLAFSYEEWNVFYSALEFVDNFLQVIWMWLRCYLFILFLWG